MARSYYSKSVEDFLNEEKDSILGKLTKIHEFNLEEQQRNAWAVEIDILKKQLINFKSGHIIFEYSIPRMGKRVDIILLLKGIVFVIEFKVGESKYPRHAIDDNPKISDFFCFHDDRKTIPYY